MTVASDKARRGPRPEQPARLEARSDETEFEALFHQYYTRIYGVLFRLVGDPGEAEDLTVETFWRMYRRPPGEAGRDRNLGGWLYRVATNLGLNAVRAWKRRQRYEQEAGRWQVSHGQADDPEEATAAGEERSRVRRVLSRMSSRQARLLVLRHSGLSYKEIAESAGVSPGSVGTLLARAEREFERLYPVEEP